MHMYVPTTRIDNVFDNLQCRHPNFLLCYFQFLQQESHCLVGIHTSCEDKQIHTIITRYLP